MQCARLPVSRAVEEGLRVSIAEAGTGEQQVPTWQGRRLRLMAADFGWLRWRFGGLAASAATRLADSAGDRAIVVSHVLS